MFRCFGFRARPAQRPSRDQSVLMSRASEGGAVPAVAAEESIRRRRPLSPVATGWRGAYGAVGKPACECDPSTMEDKVSMRPSFFTWPDGSRMHFFAVFDGHGGPQVSELCRDHMHAILADELARVAAAYRDEQRQDEEAELRHWKAALTRSFARADTLGAAAVPSGTIVGSTAVVALLVRGLILVANCGDSRAVLCRAGGAVQLSDDHKLDRPDEMARVTAAGGEMFGRHDGVQRLRGMFDMSRALGHTLLKPEVICEPEITITARVEDDDCLILASDGLWDVISNQVACHIARNCLNDRSNDALAPVGKEGEVRCVRAAYSLTNRASRNNNEGDISVIVLDLKVRD